MQGETTLLLNEPCPPAVVGKDWHTLFRDKLNIAWLPADKVFFRAVQLPSSDPAEVASMVELQLEKLSPLPVTHIVWSIYLLPRLSDKPEALQMVIVIIAARSAVEEFLGAVGRGRVSCRTAWKRPAWSNFCPQKSMKRECGFSREPPANRLWWSGGMARRFKI